MTKVSITSYKFSLVRMMAFAEFLILGKSFPVNDFSVQNDIQTNEPDNKQ